MSATIASKALRLVFLLIAAYIAFISLCNNNAMLVLLPFAALFVMMFFLKRLNINPKYFGLMLFAVSFTFKAAFVLSVQTQPISDFSLVYDAASALAQGDTTPFQSVYFQTWAYQTGPAAWMALWMKLFGAGVTFFKIQNCVFLAVTNLLVYRIARRIACEKAAQCAGVLYCFFPPVYFLTSVLTNQHLSNMLIFLGVDVFISVIFPESGEQTLFNGKNIGRLTLTGVLLGFGHVIRPQTYVVLLPMIAILLWRALRTLRVNIRKTLAQCVSVIVLLAAFAAVFLA